VASAANGNLANHNIAHIGSRKSRLQQYNTKKHAKRLKNAFEHPPQVIVLRIFVLHIFMAKKSVRLWV
jgi:hypothetical protein